MKKIPVQVTDENVKFVNDNKLSFAQLINSYIDKLRAESSNSIKDNKNEIEGNNSSKSDRKL